MIGSLFSGIGGLELGLERAGLGPVRWQVEISPFAREVLARHWPNAERFNDVTVPRSYAHVDVICGGFPCQDVSSAGLRQGLDGAKSGLWRDFARIVGEVRPRVVVVENVASGKAMWLPTVRRDLHLLGYDTTAYALSAEDVSAPHGRARIFVVAHAHGEGQLRNAEAGEQGRDWAGDSGGAWPAEPPVGRVAYGLPERVDRITALGLAVVPQCAEVIGRIVAERMAA